MLFFPWRGITLRHVFADANDLYSELLKQLPHRPLMPTSRIHLSPPHVGEWEQFFVEEAFTSNYLAPLGPMVERLEEEFSALTGFPHCLALNSGTAAMHLALRHLYDQFKITLSKKKKERPVVVASTLTFIGSVSPARFLDCDLHFIDSDRETWNMDPLLLDEELHWCRNHGLAVLAVAATDLYGQCCNVPALQEICQRHQTPLIIDSAESLGAQYYDHHGERHAAGRGGACAIYSFNGNKIITTSGGGMLASDNRELIEHARKLSQQAREAVPWYEHREIGYNYRMSNLLAALGRGQLRVLQQRVERKREICGLYQEYLADVPGISFMPEADYNQANRWLTVILIDPEKFGAAPLEIIERLEQENIESRPLWKPMHLQPVFRHCRVRGGGVSEELFALGLCLPSGTAMSDSQIEDISNLIRSCGNS